MRKLGANKDLQDRWKSLERCWMNVGLGILDLWEGNLHGVMGTQMALKFRRGWIEQ